MHFVGTRKCAKPTRRDGTLAVRQVPEGLVASCPSCTRCVVEVRRQSGPSPSLWAQPKPDFSGDFHPASHEIKQERRST